MRKNSNRYVAGLVALTLLTIGTTVAVGRAIGSEARASRTSAAEKMADAADAYLATLDADATARGTWDLAAEARFDWHFVPREREGVSLKTMSLDQRVAAHELIQSTLSPQGYLKATGVSHLEAILRELENRPEFRDPEEYYVSIFGTPSSTQAWGWRYEGHHISVNVTSVPGHAPKLTPTFIGSNPHVVREGESIGFSLLGAEERLARELYAMLDDGQRARATIAAEAPRDIFTGNARRVELDAYEGLSAGDMSEAQVEALMWLIGEYVHNADAEIARAEMTRLHEAGVERLHFAWAGSDVPGEGHYYRVHGPTILIEYDNVQGGANHVHSVWRDPENDFGDDLLRRHYEEADHHQDGTVEHTHESNR